MDATGIDSKRWTTMEGIIPSFSEAGIYDLIRSMTQLNQSLSVSVTCWAEYVPRYYLRRANRLYLIVMT